MMSLINQVLKDLEHRQVAEGTEGAAILQHVRYVPAPSNARRNKRLLSWLAVVVAVFGVASSVYLWRAHQTHSPAAPVVAVTPAPVVSNPIPVEVPAPLPTPAAVATVVAPVIAPQTPVAVVSTPSTAAPPTVQRKRTSNTATAAVAAETESDSDAVMHKQPVLRSADEQNAVSYQQAYELIGQQRWREAENQLRQALIQQPGQFRLRELLVGLYIKTGRWIEADAVLAEGLTLTPLHQPLVKLRARTLMQLNQDQRAAGVLTQYAPPIADDPDHYALLAVLQQRLGKHDQAVTQYRQLLALHPNVGVWWVGLAISLEAQHQGDEAQLAYQHARTSGNLTAEVARYTDNRLRALQQLGLGTNE